MRFNRTLDGVFSLFTTRQAYQLNIEDTEQPLLIHRPKKKTGGDLRKVNRNLTVFLNGVSFYALQQPQEQDQVICLIPELCCMTGLTDLTRADFRVMKVCLIPVLTECDHDL